MGDDLPDIRIMRAVPWRRALLVVLLRRFGVAGLVAVVGRGLVPGLESHVDAPAAGCGAALHLAGGHVVDALAGDAAAPGLLDHGVAAEDDGVAILVVVDPRRGGVHQAPVLPLLLPPNRH